MKKSIAVLVVCLFASAAGAQWSGSAPGPISYSGGNVGVNTSSPDALLQVNQTSTWPSAGLSLTSSVGDPNVQLRNTSGAGHDYRLITAGSASGVAGAFRIFDYTTGFDRFVIGPAGYVGIGTTTPSSVLTVQTTGPDSTGEKYLTMKNTSSYTGVALMPGQAGDVNWLMMAGFPNAGDFTLREWSVGNRLTIKKTSGYVGINNDNPSSQFDVTGNIHASGNISGATVTATYQDVAEWVPAVGDLPPGSVVTLRRDATNTVTASTHAYDTAVAGVISAQPGVVLGVAAATKAPVATTGRVKVRVDATKHAIGVGDLLVTSDKPGVAMASEPVDLGGVKIHRPGTLIGKALEPLAGGEGEILVLLSLQ